MFDFLKTLFNPAPPSGTTAKERLRLVLLSDHLSLSPETVQALKADLLAVISKYVEIDSSHADVTFEHRENEVAMLANIPITGVRERKRAIEENAASPMVPTPATASPTVAVVNDPVIVAPTPIAVDVRHDASVTDDIEDEIARNSATALATHDEATVQPTLELGAAELVVAPPIDADHEAPLPSKANPPTSPTAAPHTSRRRRRKKNQNAVQRPPAPPSFGKPAQA